jgi:D-glycero-D-manno-heptose 1,7-bisphosphate phosphatase
MLVRAAQALGVDLTKSWMVGDRWRDIDCGHAAGCRTILVERGYSEELRHKPDYRTVSLLAAAQIILDNSKG